MLGYVEYFTYICGVDKNDEKPYLEKTHVEHVYNPKYGDDRKCQCGHQYYRHFDSYEEMEQTGCKYCECHTFTEDFLTNTTPMENKLSNGPYGLATIDKPHFSLDDLSHMIYTQDIDKLLLKTILLNMIAHIKNR